MILVMTFIKLWCHSEKISIYLILSTGLRSSRSDAELLYLYMALKYSAQL